MSDWTGSTGATREVLRIHTQAADPERPGTAGLPREQRRARASGAQRALAVTPPVRKRSARCSVAAGKSQQRPTTTKLRFRRSGRPFRRQPTTFISHRSPADKYPAYESARPHLRFDLRVNVTATAHDPTVTHAGHQQRPVRTVFASEQGHEQAQVSKVSTAESGLRRADFLCSSSRLPNGVPEVVAPTAAVWNFLAMQREGPFPLLVGGDGSHHEGEPLHVGHVPLGFRSFRVSCHVEIPSVSVAWTRPESHDTGRP